MNVGDVYISTIPLCYNRHLVPHPSGDKTNQLPAIKLALSQDQVNSKHLNIMSEVKKLTSLLQWLSE